MGFILLFGIVAGCIVVFVLFAEHARMRTGEVNRSYQQLARRFGGVCVPGTVLRRPRLGFQYGESLVALRPVVIKGVEQVEMSLQWPDQELCCSVGTPDTEHRVSGFPKVSTTEVLTDAFPQKLFLRTNDELAIRKLFTHGVQWQLQRLWQYRNGRSLLASFARGKLTIQKQSALRRYEDLEEFVRLVLDLYDQLQLTRSVGIEFMAQDVVQPVDEAQCKVCGDLIREDLVYCRRCKTPHHLDCWRYFGTCSVYGCGERTFLVPEAPQPLPESDPHSPIRKPR